MSTSTTPPRTTSHAAAYDPAADGWSIHSEAGLIEFLGPLWERRDEQAKLRIAFLAEARHGNRRGIVHGGMLMVLADQALGIAAREANGHVPQVTIQLDTHFVSAVHVGEFVVAVPRVVRRTRSIMFMSGTLMVGERIVLAAQGIWKIT